VYFVTSNLWRIGQQQLVLNKLYDQAAPVAKTVEKPERETGPGGRGGKGAAAPTETRREGRATPGSTTGASPPPARARPNPNTAQRRKKKRKR
jgi:hypothetical protein